jgi:hypothetical protein
MPSMFGNRSRRPDSHHDIRRLSRSGADGERE